MAELKNFNLARVEKRIDWTGELFSLRVSGAPLSFKAGQFTKLALLDENGNPISRAYSVVNAPSEQFDWLEFLIVADPQGQLSPKLQKLKTGDSIYVGETAHGDLIHDSIPKQAHDLWLLSTGTGIGPFLSLLDDINLLPHNEKIVLVHGVRYEKDLVYKYLIEHLEQRYEGRLKYVPIVSREAVEGKLQGRIPDFIASGELSNRADVQFSPCSSFVMLCGNPAMIKDTLPVLQERGLEKFRVNTGGNIIYERYW
ncbi:MULTISPECIES: ferredoxin--NADP reductase [Vibrio]|jgi:ferredoxin--NADP+ reductase|uniref:ferredoxin--NADP(+) reductase n=1 Tax=Vibrio natriegens NBRC 15636 = ATCC 14048 = DSM 759 TaxID=1219067 RepID=A0AAN0Y684_VIBNA|nr:MULTISPECIES: ferredoxin--NADP reductase [Vibrio]MEE3877472.1 ferredoxin--NADP reductase [Vibrio sp. YYF0003]AEX25134.1 ferredoxin-NADP reductase [Vibrio sp. EJY3]ALR17402.1 ferredoxin-NADP reductase [Vibrio natriegens NBRC 15636 = ATCC 14048 = DSM 759]ANQ14893.1 ferredoxin--NADP(+) reductase [Vibrio natriegens NBRC 15636 = ATCC 14048 = DSM 759]ANQ23232.1 ferredoxin--NADP(+) reductase [Vibrio natriegens]